MSNGTIWTLIPLQNVAAFHLLLFLRFKEQNSSALAAPQLFISPIALAGLIGDVFLNKTPLRNFKIYSLEMKPAFMKRFVGFKHFFFPFLIPNNLFSSSAVSNREQLNEAA